MGKMMKPIREFTENIETEVITEESGKKSWYIKGITLQADVKNKNKRYYPINVLSEGVNNYVQTAIKNNTINSTGELNHPKENMHTINMENVSHKFVDIIKEGNNFITKAKVLDEQPKGRIVKNLLEQDIKLGISSRGLGDIERLDEYVKVNKLHLVTAGDIVSDPSAPDAYVSGILESIEYELTEDGKLSLVEVNNKMDNYKEIIKESSKNDVRHAIKTIMDDYIKSIVTK